MNQIWRSKKVTMEIKNSLRPQNVHLFNQNNDLTCQLFCIHSPSSNKRQTVCLNSSYTPYQGACLKGKNNNDFFLIIIIPVRYF